jgi:hypothetical protein
VERTTTKTYFHATYTGRGEFYSGIRTGERVLVEHVVNAYDGEDGSRKAAAHIAVQSLERPGAWLSVFRTAQELNDITPQD